MGRLEGEKLEEGQAELSEGFFTAVGLLSGSSAWSTRVLKGGSSSKTFTLRKLSTLMMMLRSTSR